MRNHNFVIFVLAYFMMAAFSLNLELIQEINVSGLCKNLLPYSISSVSETQYLTWYGKVGDSISGTTYLAGHLFERHVAVNQRCTTQQITEGKTVFISQAQMVRTVNMDNTNCNLGSTTQFNFRQTRILATPTEFIDGIDCKTNVRQKFKSYFVEFKRTLQNNKPSQAEYMGSQKVTVWTIYPAR